MPDLADLLRRVRALVAHHERRLAYGELFRANCGFELFDLELARVELFHWRQIEKALSVLAEH